MGEFMCVTVQTDESVYVWVRVSVWMSVYVSEYAG